MAAPNYFANATDLKGLLEVPNQHTPYFWLGMLAMIFFVLTMSFLGFGFITAVLTSSFITLILGIMLVYMGLVSWSWLMTFLGIILFLMFYITWQTRKNDN